MALSRLLAECATEISFGDNVQHHVNKIMARVNHLGFELRWPQSPYVTECPTFHFFLASSIELFP